MGWSFLDIDARIATGAGQTIAEIFRAEGEEGFRRREREECRKLRGMNRHVVAMGGGSLGDPDNRAVLRRKGKIIWLRAPAAVLWSRIDADSKTATNRPNLTAGGGLAELEAILAEREPQYRAAAHHAVDTVAISPEEIAEGIEMWFQANDAQSM